MVYGRIVDNAVIKEAVNTVKIIENNVIKETVNGKKAPSSM